MNAIRHSTFRDIFQHVLQLVQSLFYASLAAHFANFTCFNTDDTTLLYKAKTYADYFELSLGVYF